MRRNLEQLRFTHTLNTLLLVPLVLGISMLLMGGTAPTWYTTDKSNFIRFDGDQEFIFAMADAAQLMNDSYPASYYYWWASENNVTVRQWNRDGDGIGIRVVQAAMVIEIGPAWPQEIAVSADLIVMGAERLRNYHEWGPCKSKSRGLASLIAYGMATPLGVQDEAYLTWLRGRAVGFVQDAEAVACDGW